MIQVRRWISRANTVVAASACGGPATGNSVRACGGSATSKAAHTPICSAQVCGGSAQVWIGSGSAHPCGGSTCACTTACTRSHRTVSDHPIARIDHVSFTHRTAYAAIGANIVHHLRCLARANTVTGAADDDTTAACSQQTAATGPINTAMSRTRVFITKRHELCATGGRANNEAQNLGRKNT